MNKIKKIKLKKKRKNSNSLFLSIRDKQLNRLFIFSSFLRLHLTSSSDLFHSSVTFINSQVFGNNGVEDI